MSSPYFNFKGTLCYAKNGKKTLNRPLHSSWLAMLMTRVKVLVIDVDQVEHFEYILVTEPSELSDGLGTGNEEDGKYKAHSQLPHTGNWMIARRGCRGSGC